MREVTPADQQKTKEIHKQAIKGMISLKFESSRLPGSVLSSKYVESESELISIKLERLVLRDSGEDGILMTIDLDSTKRMIFSVVGLVPSNRHLFVDQFPVGTLITLSLSPSINFLTFDCGANG